MQYLAATGDLDAALNVAEFTWSQTESIRYFYGYRERGVVATRLAMTCGRARLRHDRRRQPRGGLPPLPDRQSQKPSRSQARGLVDGNADQLIDAVAMFRETPVRIAFADCCVDAACGTGRRAGAPTKQSGCSPKPSRTTPRLERRPTSIESTQHSASSEQGERRRDRTRPSFGWDALTPTEMAVTELVAEGLTNPEVGARLFVSRRTIETHLSHVFRKLDFATRTQLASEFTRRLNP